MPAPETRPRRRARGVLLASSALLTGFLPNEAHTGASARVERAASDVVWIAAGDFTMGADRTQIDAAVALCQREPGAGGVLARNCLRGQFPRSEPACDIQHVALEYGAHTVWLRAFGIDRTEVTERAFDRCVRVGACPTLPSADASRGPDERPVVLVRWTDADAYCRYRHGRLPSEAEWERAARGRDGRPFPWGFLWDPRRANHGAFALDCRDGASDGFLGPAPVGSYPDGASPDGLLDAAGNVAEWVEDYEDDAVSVYPRPSESHPDAPIARLVDPHGPTHGALRIVRGGSFDAAAFELRTTFRGVLPAGVRSDAVGFRCAYDR